MEGGIAVILLLIIFVLAAIFGIAMYVTGGALWAGKTSPRGDRVEGDGDGNGNDRPMHKRPTSPTQEKTNFVGVHHDEDERA